MDSAILPRRGVAMAEQVFGLSINQIMAYTAVANVLLVVVLTGINVYYAWHAKRQADASKEQVSASIRQAETAAETLALLRKQLEQQHRADVATVNLQLKVAIHIIEDWLKRIGSGAYPNLPAEICVLPADFNLATQRANAIDAIVAENMGAASICAADAENNLRTLRVSVPDSGEAQTLLERTAKSLNVAKYRLSMARTRWEAVAGTQP